MTNRIAVILGLILIFAIVLDVILVGDTHLLFLAKKFAQLIDWLAFWR